MTDIKQLAEVCDLVQTESESQTATLAERVLTHEAKAERDDFQAEYGYDGNCSCHISPPCNSCIHPGNPRNQEEDESAWVADGCGACGDACASNGGDCRVKEESPPVCESVQAGGESQTGQSDDPVLHALGVMTRVASAARDLLHESEEFDFPDGLGRGAPQRLWDALGSEIEAVENDGAPIDDDIPPADPALLASANRMLFDRLERVAHVLRGCGLPALADVTGHEDLQMATAALSGAYQMALAERDALAAELKSLREQMPVGIVDEGDDGVFADLETTSGVIVKLGDKLYARPVPCQDTADMVNKAFQDGINSGYAQAMEEEIARSRQVDPSTLPERDESKPAESQGLFRKFEVWRVDGSDKPGGKHHGCRYFVLDLDHDQHADAAMAAYAQACKNTHPALSAELEAQYPSEHPTKFFCYSEDIGYQEFGTLDGAITCAESMLSDARDNANFAGEWSEEETSISYGSVIGEAVEIVRGDGGYEYSISRPGNQPPEAGGCK